ncbi:MAG: hypothetical protein JRJ47_01370 [Deltaproteobacteria bacterium]|nr:hypothetical protein [Deltaproteobacteria bacterium]
MRLSKVVIAAFSICAALSLLIGSFLLFQVKSTREYCRMIHTGEAIEKSLLDMQLEKQIYLLRHNKEALENIRDSLAHLRKTLSFYEKSKYGGKHAEFLGFIVWEEAMNLYERLFDQFVLYHRAVEKNIAEIRNLEKSILAVIYSKMNPERGIIALQEIRIHEKGYLLYRERPKQPDERSFHDMRREAVANLLVWAHEDKRIEELMEEDNRLFNEILSNYESQDNTLMALERESGKMKAIGEKFLEEGNKGLGTTYRRCMFLCTALLIMWTIVCLAIFATRFHQ